MVYVFLSFLNGLFLGDCLLVGYGFNDELLEDEGLEDEFSEVPEGREAVREKAVKKVLDRDALVADVLSKPRAIAIVIELTERPKTVAELCRDTGASESSVRHHIKALLAADVVTQVKALDGRKNYLKLTPSGNDLAKAVSNQLTNQLIKSCREKGYEWKEEDLIGADCAEKQLKAITKHPTKLLNVLGFREYKYNYLKPPKKRRETTFHEW